MDSITHRPTHDPGCEGHTAKGEVKTLDSRSRGPEGLHISSYLIFLWVGLREWPYTALRVYWVEQCTHPLHLRDFPRASFSVAGDVQLVDPVVAKVCAPFWFHSSGCASVASRETNSKMRQITDLVWVIDDEKIS